MESLKQLHERDATGEVARIYEDIRAVLRSSWVPLLFRWLGAQDDLLVPVWRELRPNLLSRSLEESADDIRANLARAAGDLGAPLIEPVLAWEGLDTDAIDEVRELSDAFHYVYPKLVVTTAALSLAAGGHSVGGAALHPALEEARKPEESLIDMPSLRRTADDPAGPIGTVFPRILEALHLPGDATELRLFGGWPRFLEAVWPELAPVFEHPDVEKRLARIRDEAFAGARRLPYPIRLGVEGPFVSELRAREEDLERLFEAMPRLALLTATVKVSLDGVDDALASPWPVEWRGVTEGATLRF